MINMEMVNEEKFEIYPDEFYKLKELLYLDMLEQETNKEVVLELIVALSAIEAFKYVTDTFYNNCIELDFKRTVEFLRDIIFDL